MNIFDELEALLLTPPLSQYSRDFYQSLASTENTQRRLFALLDLNKRSSCAPDWLNELRSTAEVVWCGQGRDIDELLVLAKQPEDFDYLFLDNTEVPSVLTNLLFRRLTQETPSCDHVLFPGLLVHWSFKSFVAEKEDWHW